MSESDLERELHRRGQELMQKLLQGHLDQRGPGEAAGPVAGADGVEHRERRVHERAVETIFGTVQVGRVGYARAGHDSLHPLDASLNLPPERYSLEVRRRVAEAAASRSYDEALFELSRHTGAEVPKRQAEELAVRAAEDFDAFYEARRAAAGEPASEESVVVLTFDGKGVVLHREDLREAIVEAGAAAYGVDVTVVLDIIHVVEYVWKAAHVFHREGSPELACWAWTRVRDILEGKARRVAASMRRAATVAGLSHDTRKPVDTCADYLLKYAPYLHYDRYLAAGYPIATGVVEGACRHLVRDRMELTGARWRLVGAEAVFEAPGAAGQRRLRCLLGLPRSPRVRTEPRPALRGRHSTAGHRAALLTPPSTGQVALAMLLAESNESLWTADAKEPHPSADWRSSLTPTYRRRAGSRTPPRPMRTDTTPTPRGRIRPSFQV